MGMIEHFRISRELGARRVDRGAKGRANFSSAKIPCNQLIRLDSDERIQGNPRKSNPHKRGFSQRNGGPPRKPKPGLSGAPVTEKERNPKSSKGAGV
jgi:hypothetical protein